MRSRWARSDTSGLVNDGKPEWVLDKVRAAAEGLEQPVIAALGLAFKPDIDDLRESPALSIATKMTETITDASFLVVEPHIDVLPDPLNGIGVELVGLSEAVERADVVVLLVDHRQFKELDRARLAGKRVIDTRGTWR